MRVVWVLQVGKQKSVKIVDEVVKEQGSFSKLRVILVEN
jgi:hypothetical protein